ncbi:MAG: dephospho-CoA kinase [Candidatus Dormibacteraeota bacterium]|uniref:Dephospho-CoA kinase n=1 Tax=Candidatus Aeolococcus gillhamiae TaxID=3127015 RepID=A0A2W5Z9F1_9BACT|nr:dephospho-CoA kinase [Candidatus Dormibacteraeota bacterium]PZR81999.1 MAG: dephospho-CoA kinase [Candidatus Dormibacter sp. RRmetagenome_bin12]
MRLIGLTGGIATGKSTVAALLADRGAAVIDADAIAHEVLLPGAAAFDDVVRRFGAAVLDPGGAIDRAALGGIAFADPELRGELERITHPRINALMQERILAALQSDAPLVAADIPLLFERDGENAFEGTMLVYAPAATQLLRIRERNGLDDTAAQRRLVAQLPIEEKRGRATWVIDNQGSREATTAQVDDWWREVVEAT